MYKKMTEEVEILTHQ